MDRDKIILRYKFFSNSTEEIVNIQVEYDFKLLNIHIQNSYLIGPKIVIKSFLNEMMESSYFKEIRKAGFTRSYKSMLREWAAHNLLYEFKYKREQTKDVDLNEKESFFKKLGYTILSLFYR